MAIRARRYSCKKGSNWLEAEMPEIEDYLQGNEVCLVMREETASALSRAHPGTEAPRGHL